MMCCAIALECRSLMEEESEVWKFKELSEGHRCKSGFTFCSCHLLWRASRSHRSSQGSSQLVMPQDARGLARPSSFPPDIEERLDALVITLVSVLRAECRLCFREGLR